MSPEEKPGARDTVVPASYSTPSLAPEALELFHAFRDDVKGLRDDLVEGLEGVKQETHAGLERNAGHTLAIYRIVDQRITDHANEARAHRAEFVAFAADSRAFQQRSTRMLERILEGQPIAVPSMRPVSLDELTWWSLESVARRLAVPRATLRLVLAAVFAAVIVSTLAACVVRAV